MRTATRVAIVGAGLSAGAMLGAATGHASGHGWWCAVIEIGAGEGYWDYRYRGRWRNACRVFDVGRVMELNGKSKSSHHR
jgi:hypothetical protein